ncbi:MAG: 3'-5' exonuclease [Bacteroidota bacterium]
MHYLFFDTETTSQYQSQARLVHLAFIRTDESGEEVERFSELIRPDGFQIDNAAIHGITQAVALKNGIGLKSAMQRFMEALAQSSLLIAHNIEYDKKVLFNELKANGLTKTYFNVLYNKAVVCTMQSSTAFCNIMDEKRGRPKFPRLSELYEKLFQQTYTKDQEPLTDVETMMHCFFELKQRGIIE